MTYVCFSVSFSSLLVCTICIYSNWSLGLVKNVILPEKLNFSIRKKVFFKSLLIFSIFSVFVIVCFLSLFGAKNKHTSPTSSESAKDLVRKSDLEEKLDLCWKSQFPVQDAKI